MRKFLLTLPALALFVASPVAAKSFVINPQAGVVGQDLTGDMPDLDDSAKLGYGLGGNLRFGGRGYLSPGIYWEHTSLEATTTDDATAAKPGKSVCTLPPTPKVLSSVPSGLYRATAKSSSEKSLSR